MNAQGNYTICTRSSANERLIMNEIVLRRDQIEFLDFVGQHEEQRRTDGAHDRNMEIAEARTRAELGEIPERK